VAAELLRDRVGHGSIEIGSAGLHGQAMPVPEIGVELMRRRGLDLSGHRSQLLDPPMLHGADLVLGMERRHAREIVASSPELWPRTFVMKDFVHRAETVGPLLPGVSVQEWLDGVGRDRQRRDLLGGASGGRPAADEVPDPFGRSESTWASVIEELDDLADRIVTLLWPGALQPGDGPADGSRQA
jgi:protein-tyrosine-phosphatase